MKKMILALSLFAVSSASFAGHCVRDGRAIDAALEKVTLSAEVRGQVEKLKTDGLALHGSGDHRESEKALAEAMRLILENI
jgi:hypothetical protein